MMNDEVIYKYHIYMEHSITLLYGVRSYNNIID